MNALACLAEAFAWLIRPGIRRFILLPLAVNITLFAAGSYAAFHYSDALVESLLPGWLAWLHWLLYPLLAVAPAHPHLLQLQPDGEPHRRTV